MLLKAFFSFTSFWRLTKSPILSLWLFISLLASNSAYGAQPPLIEKLVNNNYLTEDQYGFIWLTGHSGLLRYDDNELVNFSTNLGELSVPFIWTNDIESIGEKLLVTTETRGIWLVDSNTGTASQLPAETYGYSVYYATMFNGKYYFFTSTPDNIYQYDPETSQTTLIASNIHIRNFVNTENRLYAYGHQGLFEISGQNISLVDERKVTAAAANKEKLVYAAENTLLIKQEEGQTLSKKLVSTNVTIAMDNKNENFFVVDASNTLYRFDFNFNMLPHNFTTEMDAQIFHLYHDRSDVLWAVTSKGIDLVSEAAQINHPRVYDVRYNGIEVIKLDDDIVIGSYGAGLHALSNTQLFNRDINQKFSDAGLIITDLAVVNKTLYIATFDGLWKYEKSTEALTKLDIGKNNIILLKMTQHDDKLFIGSDANGVIVYDLPTESVVRNFGIDYSLSSYEIIDILLVSNQLWLATPAGVDVIHMDTEKITHIPIKGSSKVISLTFVNSKIFAFTAGDGVFVFNQNLELLSTFAVGVNFTYTSIINNKIWAPSRQGLYQITPENHQLTMVSGTGKYSFTGAPAIHNNAVYIGHYGGVLEVPLIEQSFFDAPIRIVKTSISGKSYLNSAEIKEATANDVINLNVTSLDFRTGKEKQYQYKINNGIWYDITGGQLTLTGLSSGKYDIEVKGTNSLGQWSANRAYTEIVVAYPWYWTLQMRVVYAVTLICFIALTLWLLYLRANSINKVHQLLENELKNKGKRAVSITRSLNLVMELLAERKIDDATKIVSQSIADLDANNIQNEPDCLYGNSLNIALPYFGEYLHQKYHITLHNQLEFDDSKLDYEFQANIYKIIYEAVTSALLNGESRNFNVHIQEFKSKLWLTISDDENSFAHFNSKISFDMAMYYVRQIAEKYNASVNTFDAQDGKGSQLVVSFPLMSLS